MHWRSCNPRTTVLEESTGKLINMCILSLGSFHLYEAVLIQMAKLYDMSFVEILTAMFPEEAMQFGLHSDHSHGQVLGQCTSYKG